MHVTGVLLGIRGLKADEERKSISPAESFQSIRRHGMQNELEPVT